LIQKQPLCLLTGGGDVLARPFVVEYKYIYVQQLQQQQQTPNSTDFKLSETTDDVMEVCFAAFWQLFVPTHQTALLGLWCLK
jgi:hypothetical protein